MLAAATELIREIDNSIRITITPSCMPISLSACFVLLPSLLPEVCDLLDRDSVGWEENLLRNLR